MLHCFEGGPELLRSPDRADQMLKAVRAEVHTLRLVNRWRQSRSKLIHGIRTRKLIESDYSARQSNKKVCEAIR